MEKKTINSIVTIVVILGAVLIALFIIHANATGKAIQSGSLPEDTAKYIGENSVVYVQPGCHFCEEQEAMFGDKWQYINATNLTYDVATQQGITGTPTWVINGQKYPGVQSIETLEQLTGYTSQ